MNERVTYQNVKQKRIINIVNINIAPMQTNELNVRQRTV